MGGRGASTRGTNTPLGKTWADYRAMDMNDMGDLLDSLSDMELPKGLGEGQLQRLVYGLGINGKPHMVSEDEFDKLVAEGAVPLYRSVGTWNGDKEKENTYVDMLTDGDLPWMGRGLAGDGLYFSESLDLSKHYGGATVGAVLNKNAKVIDSAQLQREGAKMSDYTEALGGRVLDNSTLALKLGYNVIKERAGENYPPEYIVLDRSALTMSRRRY